MNGMCILCKLAVGVCESICWIDTKRNHSLVDIKNRKLSLINCKYSWIKISKIPTFHTERGRGNNLAQGQDYSLYPSLIPLILHSCSNSSLSSSFPSIPHPFPFLLLFLSAPSHIFPLLLVDLCMG